MNWSFFWGVIIGASIAIGPLVVLLIKDAWVAR